MRRRHCFAIVVVGKNTLRREGLAGILRSAHFRILASVSCADELLTRKAPAGQLLFLVAHTGDEFDATVEQIEVCRSHRPDGRIAVVADRYQLNELASAFRAGATGYFIDNTTCDVFIKSIELVMMGETVFPAPFLSVTLDPESGDQSRTGPRDNGDRAIVTPEDRIAPQLSPREKSILRCLIEGDSNKCIARKINIAEATVKVHIKAILRKIRVQNRTQAAIWGMNNRSLARPSNDRLPALSSGMSGRPPNAVREIREITRIDVTDALGADNHASRRIEVSPIDGHIRQDINATTNGIIRLRK